jgi:serine/threonine protein kinase
VYTAKSDVYSYGVLIYEVFSGGATPFGQLRSLDVIAAVKAGQLLGRPRADTPDDIVRLMRLCTKLSVGERPSMASIYAQLTGAWLLDGARPAGAVTASAERWGESSGVKLGTAPSHMTVNTAFATRRFDDGATDEAGDDDDEAETKI